MKLQFKQSENLIFIDKPAGFSTHSPDHGKWGLCEIYESFLGQKLHIVQRLDKNTTGCLALAQTREKAAELTELFQSRQVHKRYVFMTDRRSTQDSFENSHPLEGKAARTLFKRLKRNAFFELWEAFPETGRPHQIRIHASQLGLPIAGDLTYGGSPYPHLALHAQALQLPGFELQQSPLPVFMERMGLAKDGVLVRWLSELDRRQRLYGFLQNPQECLRLIHLPELRLDQFGSQLWFYWYADAVPTAQDLERFHFIGALFKKEWFLRVMQNRGSDPNLRQTWQSEGWKETWQADENGVHFQFQTLTGQSPGLFLDQRENRRRIREKSTMKKVLNLFSYTCGFSLNSALGQASEVVSVDLSPSFLEWGKQNFILNDCGNSKYEFFQAEAQLFLKGAQKRGRQFDFVICDPPSFGRHKNGVFRLDQAFEELLVACWKVLSPQGTLLFSCNLEKWTQTELEMKIRKLLRPSRLEKAESGWDFELPNEEPLMKSFWIQK